jgi:hypothetical protein
VDGGALTGSSAGLNPGPVSALIAAPPAQPAARPQPPKGQSMKNLFTASLAAGVALSLAAPSLAQVERATKVEHDTSHKDGVATTTTKVTSVDKRKTRQPKKVLGVKVGHKTAETKTVRETSRSTNGDVSTKVKTSH